MNAVKNFYWDEIGSQSEQDDPDVDVCVACGGYFFWDDRHRELVIARDGDRRPHAQECHSCLRGQEHYPERENVAPKAADSAPEFPNGKAGDAA